MNELVSHAIKKVWANPKQDFQPIVKPGRLTRPTGARRYFQPIMKAYDLPNTKDLFHVFGYTGFNPVEISLSDLKKNQWVSAIALTHEVGLFFDGYFENGMMLPRADIWVKHEGNNFFVAVKDRPGKTYLLGYDTPYFRTYMNAWWDISGVTPPFIEIYHKTISKLQDSLDTIMKINKLAGKPGYTWLIVNGYYKDPASWDGHGANIGDWVEVIHDQSVKRVVKFNLDQRTTFMSTLDLAQKYLLHYPGNTATIDFYDDIDFFVQYDNREGVYYHRNDPKAVRMLTHKDYSICVDKVVAYAHGQVKWTNTDKLSVVAIIRNGGANRPLVFESSRIHELYKLDEKHLVNAMVGLNAAIPEWEAKNLERSAYTEIMRHQNACLTIDAVHEAYGYNAVSRILSDTPKRFENVGGYLAKLTQTQMLSSGIFEYDDNGELLGWHNSQAATTYVPRSPDAVSYECLLGEISTDVDEHYGSAPVNIGTNVEFRCYTADLAVGVIQPNSWVDVTLQLGNVYTYDAKTGWLNWRTASNKLPLVRTNRKILIDEHIVTFDDGVLNLAVQSSYRLPNDTHAWLRNQMVPMGCYDVFMNGKALAKDVDYYLDFPNFYIVGKDHIVAEAQQHVVIRGTGFCDTNMNEDIKRDVGFVVDGMLSTNKRFNVRDDVTMRFVVGGKLMHRDQLDFAETDYGVTLPSSLNGNLFMACETLVPYNLGGEKLRPMIARAVARNLDGRIEAYMTNYLPDRGDGFYTVSRHYPVYSPVASGIIDAVLSGDISAETIASANTDMKILLACQPYSERWFKYDPTNPERETDERFVMVHPHPYTHTIFLTPVQYRFVKRAVNMITRNKVEFSHFVQMEA